MANVKISALPVAPSAQTTDILPIVQGGTTKQLTNALLFTSPTLVAPLLGTPASGTLTNCTGLPISTGVSGLAAGAATFLATPTSANLRALLTNETGGGVAVFADAPVFSGMFRIPYTTVAAAGATQATATAITAGVVFVNGGAAATGVILPSATTLGTGAICAVYNFNGTAINLYPATGEALNRASVNVAVSLAAGTGTIMISGSARWMGFPATPS